MIQTVTVLNMTEMVTMRLDWMHCVLAMRLLIQSVIEPFSCASRTYSESGRTAWK